MPCTLMFLSCCSPPHGPCSCGSDLSPHGTPHLHPQIRSHPDLFTDIHQSRFSCRQPTETVPASSGLFTDIFSVITKWFTISIHRQWQFSNVSECVKSKCEWQHDISVWNASTDSHAPRPGKERVDDQAGDNSLEIPTIQHLCLFVILCANKPRKNRSGGF